MGSPLSSIMAKVFLQHLEQRKVKLLLEDKKYLYYNRYVDDIFIIYNQSKITPQHIVMYLHYAGHPLPRCDVTVDTAVTTQLWTALGSVP
jgi:hypothetical protein